VGKKTCQSDNPFLDTLLEGEPFAGKGARERRGPVTIFVATEKRKEKGRDAEGSELHDGIRKEKAGTQKARIASCGQWILLNGRRGGSGRDESKALF